MVATGVTAGGRRVVEGDAEARFEIGSITKVFTGVLLADMHLRNEVSLQDPLSRHLREPDLQWSAQEPTLLDLATHRSGLPNTPPPLSRRELWFALGFGERDPWEGVTREQHSAYVERAARRARGGRFRYSSLGFGLLGDALAAAAGRPYGELLRERILDPLEMHQTSLDSADQVQGHSPRGKPRPPLEDLLAAAGGLRSTVGDMLRFLEACLEPSPAMALAQSRHSPGGKGMANGLGWLILSHPRRPTVTWHNGGTWGFRSFAGFSPDSGRAAVVLSNRARSVDRQGFDLLQLTTG